MLDQVPCLIKRKGEKNLKDSFPGTVSKKTNGSSPQGQGSHVNSDVGLWIRSRPEPHRGPCLTRQNKHDNLKPLKMRQRNKSSVPVKPWLDNTYSERVAIVFPEGSEKSHLQVYGALVIKCLAVAKQPKVNEINHTFSKSTSLDVVSCLKFSQDFFFQDSWIFTALLACLLWCLTLSPHPSCWIPVLRLPQQPSSIVTTPVLTDSLSSPLP